MYTLTFGPLALPLLHIVALHVSLLVSRCALLPTQQPPREHSTSYQLLPPGHMPLCPATLSSWSLVTTTSSNHEIPILHAAPLSPVLVQHVVCGPSDICGCQGTGSLFLMILVLILSVAGRPPRGAIRQRPVWSQQTPHIICSSHTVPLIESGNNESCYLPYLLSAWSVLVSIVRRSVPYILEFSLCDTRLAK